MSPIIAFILGIIVGGFLMLGFLVFLGKGADGPPQDPENMRPRRVGKENG